MDKQGLSTNPSTSSGNNTGLVVAILLVLLILGGGGFFLFSRSRSKTKDTSSQAAQTEQAAPTATNAMQKQSLKNLMSMSSNQMCTFQDNETGSAGTMYIGSGKVRGDFTGKMTSTTVTSHMIATGQEVYMWMDGQKTGFKMTMSAMETPQASVSNTVDLNRQVAYECSPQTPDASLFAIPTTVTFTDYSKMMQNPAGMMESTKSGSTGIDPKVKAQQCAACAQLPASQQAQCKAALKCQ